MIVDPPRLTLCRDVTRPPAALITALAEAPSGHLVDCLGGRGALDYRIKPLSPECARFAGVAVTCHCGPADNLAVFAAIALARAGDVVVAACDGFTGTAVVGDLLLGMARNRGVVGFVTDGLVRDSDGIIALGVPTFSRGVSPNSPARNGPGSAGLPVNLGDVTIASGDLVVGDRDGVVVVPRRRLEEASRGLAGVRAAEADLEAQVAAGLEIPDFVQDLLAGARVVKGEGEFDDR